MNGLHFTDSICVCVRRAYCTHFSVMCCHRAQNVFVFAKRLPLREWIYVCKACACTILRRDIKIHCFHARSYVINEKCSLEFGRKFKWRVSVKPSILTWIINKIFRRENIIHYSWAKKKMRRKNKFIDDIGRHLIISFAFILTMTFNCMEIAGALLCAYRLQV